MKYKVLCLLFTTALLVRTPAAVSTVPNSLLLASTGTLNDVSFEEGYQEDGLIQEPTEPTDSNHHALVYQGPDMPLPSLAQFQKDLPFIQRFLKLQSLRFYVSTEQALNQKETLNQLFRKVQQAGYDVEIVIQPFADTTQFAKVLKWFESLSMLKLVALSVPENLSESSFLAQYALLKSAGSFKHGLLFHAIKDILHFKKTKALPPDLYLYHFKAPLSEIHTHVLRLNQLLERPWQLAHISVPSNSHSLHTREYDNTWLYRFAFYFSKKYGLVPAPAFVSAHQQKGFRTPGILRSDGSFLPAYWLTHIYYHLNRIDLDEKKLTRALYAEIPHGEQGFDSYDTFIPHFLNTYYKVFPDDHILNYVRNKKTPIFYEFLKIQTEESLLNSHFARLRSQRLVTQKEGHVEVELNFLSALGKYSFLQTLQMQKKQGRFWVERTEQPTLSAAFKTYVYAPELRPKVTALFSEQFNVKWRTYRPLDKKNTQPHLLFDVNNDSKDTVDLLPLALTSNTTERVYIPEPLFFEFFKQLLPDEHVRGVLPFPSEDGPFRFEVTAEQTSDKTPRSIETGLEVKDSELKIHLKNTFVERLLLPGLAIFIEQGNKLFTLEYVLPQALLPLESRTYTLNLPRTFQKGVAFKAYARATAYPIVDREINLDDAFRSDVLGFDVQALSKYRNAFWRFGHELTAIRRFRIARRILFLSAGLETVEQTEAAFVAMQDRFRLNGRAWAALRLQLAEAFLSHSQTAAALNQLEQAFAKKDWQPRIQDYMLLGYVLKQTGNRSASERRYLQALSLALSQKTDVQELFKILVDLAESRRDYAQAASLLKQWMSSPSYQRVVRHWKRLAYLELKGKQPEEALKHFLNYASLSHDVSIYPDIASLYRLQKKPSQAIVWYKKYVNQCKSCDRHMYKELGYLLKEREPRQALDYYMLYLRGHEDTPVQRIAINLAVQQRRYSIALTYLEAATVKCRTNCAQLWQQKGFVLKKLGRPAAALASYRRAWLSKGSLDVTKEVAYLAVQQKEYSTAIKAFEQLIRRQPSNAVAARLALSEVYAKQNRFQDVLKTLAPLENAILVQGLPLSQRRALLKRYLSAAEKQNTAQALKFFKQAQQTDSLLDADSYYLAARLYQKQGRIALAAEALQRAIKKSADPVPVYYRLLASLYEKQGDLEQATYWLERLKAYFPDLPDVEKTASKPRESQPLKRVLTPRRRE